MSNKWKNIHGIGLGIVAFEGTEHLANIITEFRDIVDYVVIGLQRKSYHGDPIDPTDLNEIFRLKDEDHLVDNVLEVELDTKKEPRIQETDKRNMLIQDIENNGCSHAIIIDSDEYYTHKSILRAVQEIDENDYEITYCQYVNYYADYRHFLVYPFKDGMYVPFVTKTKYRHSFDCTDFPLPSDPTRRYVRPFDREDNIMTQNGQVQKIKHYTVEYHIFPWETVKMHHLSWLRADMRKKLNNWSSKTCFKEYDNLIDKAMDTYEHFDHNSNEQQMASLLFNTPNHEVFVRAFPKQYIHPKFNYLNRLCQVKNEKSIAVMNLSSTNSEVNLYEKLDKCCQETWAKDIIDGKYSNIDYWTVIDCKEESHIDIKKHIIYIKTDYTKDNTKQLINRFLEGYEILSKYKKYDYVIRTNTSTWVNIEFINEMLAYQTDESIIYTNDYASAFWSNFDLWIGGALIIISSRNIRILDDMVKKINPAIINAVNDDVLLSLLWYKRSHILGIIDKNKFFISLTGGTPAEIDIKNIIKPVFRVKTENVNHSERIISDIKNMITINNIWNEYRKTLSDEDFSKYVKDYILNQTNKFIHVFKFSRKEWLNAKNDNERQVLQNNSSEIMPYNEETFKLLEELKKTSL